MNFKIGDVEIGGDNPCRIVAEISANHCGSIEKAKELILEAKNAGADLVKMQIYKPEDLTIDCKNDNFKIKEGIWKGYYLYDLYTEAQTPYEWFPILKEYSDSIGIPLFSSAFSKEGFMFLEDHNCPAYKIASPEVCDFDLIEYVTGFKKPIIISTGVSNKDEINTVSNIMDEYKIPYAVLICVSKYPTNSKDYYIKSDIDYLLLRNDIIGLSCHALSFTPSIVAVGLGAKIIEKHIRLNNDNSVDSDFSLFPYQFKHLVNSIKETEILIKEREPFSNELGDVDSFSRRSLFIIKDVKEGETISFHNVSSIRPNVGIAPYYISCFIGKKFINNYKKGTPFFMGMIRNE